MGLLIDSGVIIAHERDLLDLDARVRDHRDEAFFLSVVSASELLHGVWRADSPQRRAKRTAFVEAVLERFPLLPVDLAVARTHAEVWADLAARGLMIGMNDTWLAATCLTHDLTLATGNERHFERVPDLKLEVWT